MNNNQRERREPNAEFFGRTEQRVTVRGSFNYTEDKILKGRHRTTHVDNWKYWDSCLNYTRLKIQLKREKVSTDLPVEEEKNLKGFF